MNRNANLHACRNDAGDNGNQRRWVDHRTLRTEPGRGQGMALLEGRFFSGRGCAGRCRVLRGAAGQSASPVYVAEVRADAHDLVLCNWESLEPYSDESVF